MKKLFVMLAAVLFCPYKLRRCRVFAFRSVAVARRGGEGTDDHSPQFIYAVASRAFVAGVERRVPMP